MSEITIKGTEIFKKVATVNWPKMFYKAAQDPKAWSWETIILDIVTCYFGKRTIRLSVTHTGETTFPFSIIIIVNVVFA